MYYRRRFHVVAIQLALLLAVGVIWHSPSHAQDTASTWYTKKTTWNGFDQFHFRIAGSSAYLVVPTNAAKGNPWIWRARFPGFHAEMDIELVKQGFHLAYFDVAGKFGCPDVITRADEFYSFLVDGRGLNPKASMEGVSRGGLFVYNWSAKHPSRVASIYCDTPVCDFRSWPGGQGKGIGSPGAWKQCLDAYGLTEQQAQTYDKLPINHAEVLAKAKIPILHIVSDNDRVVPPKENTYVLKAKLAQLRHDMPVISVAEGTEKSNGHHFDHPEPQRVIDFFVDHQPR